MMLHVAIESAAPTLVNLSKELVDILQELYNRYTIRVNLSYRNEQLAAKPSRLHKLNYKALYFLKRRHSFQQKLIFLLLKLKQISNTQLHEAG